MPELKFVLSLPHFLLPFFCFLSSQLSFFLSLFSHRLLSSQDQFYLYISPVFELGLRFSDFAAVAGRTCN